MILLNLKYASRIQYLLTITSCVILTCGKTLFCHDYNTICNIESFYVSYNKIVLIFRYDYVLASENFDALNHAQKEKKL